MNVAQEESAQTTCSLEELVTRESKGKAYYCNPLLPVGGRMVIGAPPKSFKSMLALNLAYDLAEGTPVFGVFAVPQPITVLMVEMEIGEHRLKDRMQKIHEARGGEFAGHTLHFASKDLRITLDTASGLANLKERIERVNPEVLILDPLRKLHRKSENSSDDMCQVFGNLEKIQQAYSLTVVMVHHAGKPGEFTSMSSPLALRGSSEIFGDPDTVVMITKPSEPNKNLIQLNFTWRSDAEPPPLRMLLDSDTLQFARYA